MATASHGACGKSWIQRGNRTGHCSACHETFEGLAVFDAHRRNSSDSTRVCIDPVEVTHQGKPLRFINGTWRGPAAPDGTFDNRGDDA